MIDGGPVGPLSWATATVEVDESAWNHGFQPASGAPVAATKPCSAWPRLMPITERLPLMVMSDMPAITPLCVHDVSPGGLFTLAFQSTVPSARTAV